MLPIKPDFLLCFFFFFFGSDTHEPVNHLFLGSAACESRPKIVLSLGAITLEERNSEMEVCVKHQLFLLSFQLWAASDLLLYCCHACKYEESRSLVVSYCLLFVCNPYSSAITASLPLGAASCCKMTHFTPCCLSYKLLTESNVKSSLFYDHYDTATV